MTNFRLPQAEGSIAERPTRTTMSRATHHEIHHTTQETGGLNNIFEKKKQIKLSEIKMEENDTRTCGTNSVRGRANQIRFYGHIKHEVSVAILHRELAGSSLGITLAGGADFETKEITVHKVLTGSNADRDGRVHRGDRVLSINGKNTKGLTHREALNLLKAPRTEVVLVVSRGRSGSNGFQTIEETSATLDRAVEPLLNGSLASLLENDEDTSYRWGPMKTVILIKDGAGLGFSLDGGKGSIAGDKPLTVKKIFVGGPAEKSGELKVGDLITSINDSNMSSKARMEAWNFMKKLVDGGIKLTIRSPLTHVLEK